jgi:adenosylhomocysteinase
MTIQTAVLIETLVELGAEVRWCLVQHLLDAGSRRGGHRRPHRGIPVFAWKGETLEEYWWCTASCSHLARRQRPELILDDGGDATMMVLKGAEFEKAGSIPEFDRHPEELGASTSCSQEAFEGDPGPLAPKIERDQGRLRGDHHRRPSPLPDGRERRAALPGHQRQRLASPRASSTTSTAAATRWSTASSAPPT